MSHFIITGLDSLKKLEGRKINVWRETLLFGGLASVLKTAHNSCWLVIIDSQGHQFAIHQDNICRYNYELLDN